VVKFFVRLSNQIVGLDLVLLSGRVNNHYCRNKKER